MNLLDPISKIMTTELITLRPTDSIADAARIFENNKVHHIPIIDKDRLSGIVSKSDYLFFRRGFMDNREDEKAEKIRMNNYEVSYIMTRGIASLEASDKINVALEVFKVNLFHAIPIVDGHRLIGMVTTFDIIKNLADDNEAHAKYELNKC